MQNEGEQQFLRELYEEEPYRHIGKPDNDSPRIGREEHSLATTKEKAKADLKEYRTRLDNLNRQLDWAKDKEGVSKLALRRLRSKIRFVARLIQRTQQQYDNSY